MIAETCCRPPIIGALLFKRPRRRGTARGPLGDPRGFTLTELLVSLAVVGLVMAAAAEVQISGGTMLMSGENLAEALSAARVVMLMEEDLRLIGNGYPSSQTRIAAATTSSITFWADVTGATTVLSAAANAGATTLTVNTTAGLTVGDTIYLISGNQWENKNVSSLGGGGTTITISAGTTTSYPQGTIVGRPRQVVYSWAGGTLSKDAGDGSGAQTITTGVQSLQFSYFDTNDASISTPVSASNLPNIRRISIATTAQSTATQNRGVVTITSDVRPRNL